MLTAPVARLAFALETLALLTMSVAAADRTLSDLERQQAAQVAKILGLDGKIGDLNQLRHSRGVNSARTLEELSVRQELLEEIEAASLDVDGVLAELSSERNQLSDLLTSLQNRRDRTVGRLNAAALLAGSGVSAGVSATQFHNMSNRTQDVGDAIGIGSGVAATVLSIMAVRKQNGPSSSVGQTPNMLAPLLGGTPVLNAYYPPAVMQYLEAIPPDAGQKSVSRLDQLKTVWGTTGRLSASTTAAGSQKIRAVTTSANPDVKVNIQDITDRMAMLGDVMGRVSLMKRDIGLLMRSYTDLDLRNSGRQPVIK